MKFDFKKEKEQMPREEVKVEVSQENQTHITNTKLRLWVFRRLRANFTVFSTHWTFLQAAVRGVFIVIYDVHVPPCGGFRYSVF